MRPRSRTLTHVNNEFLADVVSITLNCLEEENHMALACFLYTLSLLFNLNYKIILLELNNLIIFLKYSASHPPLPVDLSEFKPTVEESKRSTSTHSIEKSWKIDSPPLLTATKDSPPTESLSVSPSQPFSNNLSSPRDKETEWSLRFKSIESNKYESTWNSKLT